MPYKKGKFIVIEGVDGSGKSIQSELLRKELSHKGYRVRTRDIKANQISFLEESIIERGFKVEVEDFPRYKYSAWGKLIGKMLLGEFGNLFTISPYLSVLPYMIDEYWGGLKIKKWIEMGKYVISNRYFTSNVHQIAKMKGGEQKRYREWLWKTGWQEMKIFKPDLVLVLFVDPKICYQNILKKQKRDYAGKDNIDQAEANFEHQKRAYREYKRTISENRDWWVGINCSKKGKMLAPEVIAKNIFDIVQKIG